MISAALQLAWQYSTRHFWRSFGLVITLGLLISLPLSFSQLLERLDTLLQTRARQTPYLAGARGSAVDLFLVGLYFHPTPLPGLTQDDLNKLRTMHTGSSVPVHVNGQVRQAPLVGTELDYFPQRHLQLAAGGFMRRLGDCVVGAAASKKHGWQLGGSILTTQQQVFDLAGSQPVKLRITGILAPAGSVDDEAVFIDLKTSWLIQGLAHGHEEATQLATTTVAETRAGKTQLSATAPLYTEVTDDNISRFHFHGDPASFPISAVLIFPADEKSGTLLAGRFLDTKQPLQLIRPLREWEKLSALLWRIQQFSRWLSAGLGILVLGITSLVFTLSFQLRQRQFQLLRDLGVPTRALRLTRRFEILLAIAAAALLALGLQLGIALIPDSAILTALSWQTATP
jgi:putative ABC transport system permease protein